jgi:hypothetical protein
MGAGLDNRTVRNWRLRRFPGMHDEPEITAIDVDQLWLGEWAGEGLGGPAERSGSPYRAVRAGLESRRERC